MKYIFRWAIPVILLHLACTLSSAKEPAAPGSGKNLRITIIYDNYQAREDLKTDWGFSCLVEYAGHSLLFDAGNNEALFKENMHALGLSPDEIPDLFISHSHGDHTAGLSWICSENPSVKCHLPSTYMKQLKSSGSLPPHSQGYEEPAHMQGPFYSTGDQFPAFHEQGLIIKTSSGGVLVTGCGHPGPAEMIRLAEKELGIEIHTLIGGLHLMRMSDRELEGLSSELKELGIQRICPTHCTGERAIAFLKSSFEAGFIAGGTGQEIELD